MNHSLGVKYYDHYSSLNLFNFSTLFVPVKNNYSFPETCSLDPCDARLLFFSLLLWIVLSFLFSALWSCLSAILTLHTLHFPSFYTVQENSFILMASNSKDSLMIHTLHLWNSRAKYPVFTLGYLLLSLFLPCFWDPLKPAVSFMFFFYILSHGYSYWQLVHILWSYVVPPPGTFFFFLSFIWIYFPMLC